MLNVAILLEDSARRYSHREALILGETRLTYAGVNDRANQVANLLVSRGIGVGDKVALSCPNLPDFPAIYYGILKAGAVVVPLNILLKAPEIAYHLDDAGAKAYFCFEGTPELPLLSEGGEGFRRVQQCEHLFVVSDGDTSLASPSGAESLDHLLNGESASFDSVLTGEDDTAVVLYTSGTTGQPKGAMLSHSNLVMNAVACNRLFGNAAHHHDRHLVTLPLFHSFGATVQMNAGFSTGATLVLLPRFDAQHAVSLFESEQITFFAGVPSMWWSLLQTLGSGTKSKRVADTLRVAVSGGAALSIEIIKNLREQFGVSVLEGYGLSETSPVATFTDPQGEQRHGSIGTPVWGVELKLIGPEGDTIYGPDKVGEIAIRGHNVMQGYLNRPNETPEAFQDGWFLSGDLGRRDKDGWYYIVDRAKDLIIRNGYNVYPREVEEVLMTNEDVSLVAVVGVPHQAHGEEVKAFVILNEGASATSDDLVAWTKERMGAHKYPRIVEFVKSLPMTATGKILKRELSSQKESSR